MTTIEQFAGGDGRFVRRYEYEDALVYAADFGPTGVDPVVDVVGDTVIVVLDDEQLELDVGADAQAFMKNGVLTIECESLR